MNDIYFARGN